MTLNKVCKKWEKAMKNTVSGHQPFVVFDQVCKYYQMGIRASPRRIT